MKLSFLIDILSHTLPISKKMSNRGAAVCKIPPAPPDSVNTLVREFRNGGFNINPTDDKKVIIEGLRNLREKDPYIFTVLWFPKEFESGDICIVEIMKHHGIEFAYEIFYFLGEKSDFLNRVVFERRERLGNPALWFYKLGENKMETLFLAIDEIYHRNFNTLWLMDTPGTDESESFMNRLILGKAPETGRLEDLLYYLNEFNVTEREFHYHLLNQKLPKNFNRPSEFMERVEASINRLKMQEFDQDHYYLVAGPKLRDSPLREVNIEIFKDVEDAFDFMLSHRDKLPCRLNKKGKCGNDSQCFNKLEDPDDQKKILMKYTFGPKRPKMASFEYPCSDPKHDVVFEVYRLKAK
jgi:hypothetical protein